MKKASLYETWPELFFILFLVIGILFSFLSRAPWMSYMVIFLSGMVIGRLGYVNRHKQVFPIYFVVFGYLVGFFVANYFSVNANYAILVLVLVGGVYISYKIHELGHIR